MANDPKSKKLAPTPAQLQGMILLAVSELRALKEVCVMVWESQGVKLHAKDPIKVVLGRMEKEFRENFLAASADVDHNYASEMKKFVDGVFERKPKK